MISPTLLMHFVNAAAALANGLKDTGFTSNGLRKLDFKAADESGKAHTFTAIEQNPNKLSVPAKLAREGHKIVQIRDDDAGVLLGNVDVDEKRFNSYEAIPTLLDISEIEKALGDNVVKPDEIQVTAARTAVPPVTEPKKAA